MRGDRKTMIVNSSFLLSTILLIFYWGSVLPFDQRNNAMTEEVISALDRVLDFYERDYKSINLDGSFGLRVAQGELNIDQIKELILKTHLFHSHRTLINLI